MLCSNKVYGVPYINGYAFPIDNFFSSYNGNQRGNETQIKIVEPKEKREKIKINTKQKKWTLFKITIACKDKNSKIHLKIEDILSKEYIHNTAAENNNEINEDENNIDTGQNNINENENVLLKKFNNHKLNAFIVEDSDVNFTVGNIINAGNKEEGNKTYYYVLVNDITTMKNEQDKYAPLFSALEKTAIDKNFTYSIEIIAANTTEVTNMRSMFDGCRALTEIKGLDKWNTGNVTYMYSMFYCCKSLKSLPDISKWNTSNVINMSGMFEGCSNLRNLPDISRWNTSNVTNMSWMFCRCNKLKSLPDISKWDTIDVTDMEGMFNECSSLESLPDISKWDTSKVTNMGSMFNGCNSLKSLPDISKWDTGKVTNMGCMFAWCKSLKSLPDISKWNTSNVKNMSSMFWECESLKSLPDISNWDTGKVTDISYMFNECRSLEEIIFNNWQNFTVCTAILKQCKTITIKPQY